MADVNMSESKRATLVLVVLALIAQTQVLAQSEGPSSCTNELSNLNVCAPFVVPGSTDTSPSPDCCGALQSVDRDCLCNTLRVAARLPAQCNLPALNCGN